MRIKSYVFVLICGLAAQKVFADQYHHHNLIVGERAMGLGGAFTAISDDASGVIYNPAGIGFALSNDISGSANAFYTKKLVYKKTISDQDFTEKSKGSLSPFFGGLQKLDSTWQGFAMAGCIYSVDSELKDQNDLIENIGSLERFHRTTNIRAATTGYGLGAAKRILGNMSIGAAFSLLTIDELTQEYQDVQYVNGSFLSQNYRTLLSGTAIAPALGIQYSKGSWSFGATIRTQKLLSESYDVGLDLRTNRDSTGQVGTLVKVQKDEKIEAPLKTLPSEIRLGLAWFPSATVLWSFDVIHHTAAKSDNFNREAVTNFATGTEYYITPSIPLRLGIFTNYDTRPKVEVTKVNQQDHVDYMGYSLFFGWVQPNSQISAGVVMQDGEGKAQKIQGSAVQTVEALSYTFALSATHSF
ncbi:MAG: hypothetical protein NTX25_11080 [Proteobacteria bacterium]|nr:hypothetical protein [Pseudomonadota bacterium]